MDRVPLHSSGSVRSGRPSCVRFSRALVIDDLPTRDQKPTEYWAALLSAALVISRNGISKDAFKIGDPINTIACIAKDGSHCAAARTVTVPGWLENKPVGFCYPPE